MRQQVETHQDRLAHSFAVIQIQPVEVFDDNGTPRAFIDPTQGVKSEIGCMKCDLSLDEAHGKPCSGGSDA